MPTMKLTQDNLITVCEYAAILSHSTSKVPCLPQPVAIFPDYHTTFHNLIPQGRSLGTRLGFHTASNEGREGGYCSFAVYNDPCDYALCTSSSLQREEILLEMVMFIASHGYIAEAYDTLQKWVGQEWEGL